MNHLSEIKAYIELLLASREFHLMIVRGPAGWGKSSLTRKVLSYLGTAYRELGAYSTPLALFNGLVSDPDGLLLIDDCAGIFHNPLALSVLNAATWPAGSDGRRTVRWTSTSEKSAAESVDFCGKIIVLTNFMPETPQALALQNRALTYNLTFAREAIAGLLEAAAVSKEHFSDPDVAVEVARFLGEQARFSDASNVSLRTLRMGYEFALVAPDNWRSLLSKSLPALAPEQIVFQLSKTQDKVETQLAEFNQRTGLGRRKFFYLRQELGIGTKSGLSTSKRRPIVND